MVSSQWPDASGWWARSSEVVNCEHLEREHRESRAAAAANGKGGAIPAIRMRLCLEVDIESRN